MKIRVKTVESVKDGDIDSTEGRVGGFVGLADRIPRLRKTTPPATPPPHSTPSLDACYTGMLVSPKGNWYCYNESRAVDDDWVKAEVN